MDLDTILQLLFGVIATSLTVSGLYMKYNSIKGKHSSVGVDIVC